MGLAKDSCVLGTARLLHALRALPGGNPGYSCEAQRGSIDSHMPSLKGRPATGAHRRRGRGARGEDKRTIVLGACFLLLGRAPSS